MNTHNGTAIPIKQYPGKATRAYRCRRIRRASAPRVNGFTLIELLVVVAIIAVLIAILLPSLQVARNQAKITVCMAHLHTIGSGFSMYLHDNNDMYYEAVEGSGRPNREFAQGGRPLEGSTVDVRPLNEYMGDEEVFKCLGDRGRAAVPWSEISNSIWDFAGTSYRFNAYGIPEKWLPQQAVNPNRNIANNATRVRFSDRFIVMADFNIADIMWESTSGFVSGMYGITGLQGSANFHSPLYGNPTSNVLFQDGHCTYETEIHGIGGDDPYLSMLPGEDW